MPPNQFRSPTPDVSLSRARVYELRVVTVLEPHPSSVFDHGPSVRHRSLLIAAEMLSTISRVKREQEFCSTPSLNVQEPWCTPTIVSVPWSAIHTGPPLCSGQVS